MSTRNISKFREYTPNYKVLPAVVNAEDEFRYSDRKYYWVLRQDNHEDALVAHKEYAVNGRKYFEYSLRFKHCRAILPMSDYKSHEKIRKMFPDVHQNDQYITSFSSFLSAAFTQVSVGFTLTLVAPRAHKIIIRLDDKEDLLTMSGTQGCSGVESDYGRPLTLSDLKAIYKLTQNPVFDDLSNVNETLYPHQDELFNLVVDFMRQSNREHMTDFALNRYKKRAEIYHNLRQNYLKQAK